MKFFIAMIIFSVSVFAQGAFAAEGIEIDASADVALNNFYSKVTNGKDLVNSAKGVLVFPNVYKAGFVVGGEYGQGALRINNKTVDYYNIITGSYGFQLGLQKKSVILLFMEDSALQKFQNSSNWKAGVDASVALIAVGADGSINTAKLNKPILGFVIGQKGLMYNLTLEGSKISKINK